MTTDQLMKEVERYLAAVALFRQLGCEPEWVGEDAGSTESERVQVALSARLP